MNDEKDLHHMPILVRNDSGDLIKDFSQLQGAVSFPLNFDQSGGLTIRFNDSAYNKIYSVCTGIFTCIRGYGDDSFNRILHHPFSFYSLSDVVYQARKVFRYWFEDPIPQLFIYENLDFPDEGDLVYTRQQQEGVYEFYPFLKSIDLDIENRFRLQWEEDNQGQGEQAFLDWVYGGNNDLAEERKKYFISYSGNLSDFDFRDGRQVFVEGGDLLAKAPATGDHPLDLHFRVVNESGCLVEPMAYFRALRDHDLFAIGDPISGHPIFSVYGSGNVQPMKVVIKEDWQDYWPNLSDDDKNWLEKLIDKMSKWFSGEDDWIRRLHRIPLGYESSAENPFPASEVYHYFEYPDKYGADLTITRSDGGLIEMWWWDEETKHKEASGTLIHTIEPDEEYDSTKLSFVFKMEDLDGKNTKVSLKCRREMKLKYRPWNFFYFQLGTPDNKARPPATSALDKYDRLIRDKFPDELEPGAYEWEMNYHKIAGTSDLFPGPGHCDNMSIAAAIFKPPHLYVNNDLELYHDIQILWAEWVGRAICVRWAKNLDDLYKRFEGDDNNSDGEPGPEAWKDSSPILLFSLYESKIATLPRFHTILQRYLAKGIPLIAEVGPGTTFNNAVCMFTYEYCQKVDNELESQTFTIKAQLITNFNLGSIPSPNVNNEEFGEKYNEWCVVYLIKYDLMFENGSIINQNGTTDEVFRSVQKLGIPDEIDKESQVVTHSDLTNQSWDDLKVNLAEKITKVNVNDCSKQFPIRQIWKTPRYRVFHSNGDEVKPIEITSTTIGMGNPKVTRLNLERLGVWELNSPDIHETINDKPYDDEQTVW